MSISMNAVLAAMAVAALGGGLTLQAEKKKIENVNVVNVPAVTIDGVPSVRVVDERIPVQFHYEVTSTVLGHSMDLAQAYQVPEGKRLTITHASGATVTGSGVYIVRLMLQAVPLGTTNGRASVSMALGSVYPTSSDRNVGNFGQSLDFVVNSTERVGLGVVRSSAFVDSPPANIVIDVSGYLIDEPAF